MTNTALFTNKQLLDCIIDHAKELKLCASMGGNDQHFFDLHSDGVELAIIESQLARLIDTIDQESIDFNRLEDAEVARCERNAGA